MKAQETIKHTIAAVLMALAVAFFAADITAPGAKAEQKKAKAQTLCPVMGEPINREFFVDYKGYRIYFCCSSCPDEFRKDPERYMKKLRESGVTLEKSPAGKKGGAKKGSSDKAKHAHH